jgi:molybdopterin converting factor small subunit
VNVRVRLVGFPELKRLLGKQEIDVESEAETLGDLLAHLKDKYGPAVVKLLLDDRGRLDPSVQVIRNEGEWLKKDDLSQPLREGDLLTFLLLVAGG